MAVLPFLLARTNKDNDPFLKRLAFQLQYGLMAILGCSIARKPSSSSGISGDTLNDDEGESWYHIGDKIFGFATFFLLFAYTSKKNTSLPSGVEGLETIGMVQRPHEGHGMNPRTFLVLFGIAGLLPLVKKFPLYIIVPQGTDITERAKFFYSLSQCFGLAVLMILFVPIHFGTEKDQRNTTIAIIGIEFVGAIMFSGDPFFVWIRPGLHRRLLFGPIAVFVLAVFALIGGGKGKKQAKKEYAVIPDDSTSGGVNIVV